MRRVGIVLFGGLTVFGKLPSVSSVEPGENDKKAVNQAGTGNRTVFFRVHMLCGRGLAEGTLES